MTKRKTRNRTEKLFNSLRDIAKQSEPKDTVDGDFPMSVDSPEAKSQSFGATLEEAQESGELVRMKKFRSQLLHQWLIEHFEPCRVADVGGGKGLLTYLLQKSGWEAVVIDPLQQPLPDKYKDISHNKRINIPPTEMVPHINKEFEPAMAQNYDFLIGMHAHASNIKIIDAAAKYHCGFVLLPCCIIDEPIYPAPGVHWLECLADYAVQKGFTVRPFRLNFRGQNIGFYAAPGGLTHAKSAKIAVQRR
ncbi:MAG: hypothetical protein WAM60_08900 [Candidatus Promineifilaceae bacterium]